MVLSGWFRSAPLPAMLCRCKGSKVHKVHTAIKEKTENIDFGIIRMERIAFLEYSS
jgi:hypothetical protein